MGALRDREVAINVGGLVLASRSSEGEPQPLLRVQFKVTRSTQKEPNTAEIAIYNLNKQNRAKLQEKDSPTTIDAGYSDNISQIFSGELSFGSSTQQGTDWITTVQSGDGVAKFRSARINQAFKGPVKITALLEASANALGLDLGNLSEKLSAGSLRKDLQEFTEGRVLSGKAEKVMGQLLKSMGYGLSIQGGQYQILGPSEVVEGKVARLAVDNGVSTGLVGSPEPGEKGIVKVKALLQPNLIPGRKIQIQSNEVDGFFKILKVVYTGDTWGKDWYADLEVQPL